MATRTHPGLAITTLVLSACAHPTPPVATSTSTDHDPTTAPTHDTAAHAAADPAKGGRLSAKQIADLGPPADSPCRAQHVPPGLKSGSCNVVGPYQGIISGTSKGAATPDASAALDACRGTPGCIGVSADWYGGASWYPVRGADRFAIDGASYGCTLVLDCRDGS